MERLYLVLWIFNLFAFARIATRPDEDIAIRILATLWFPLSVIFLNFSIDNVIKEATCETSSGQ